MFLRPNLRHKDGKDHTYWFLVETVRPPDGPRRRTLCYLDELNGSAHWLKTIEVWPCFPLVPVFRRATLL
jgi:hypothetical protein